MTFPIVYDRVKETSTTTGTGTFTLAGAVSSYLAFTTVLANKDVTPYAIEGGSEWEVGVGTFTTSGTTLSRDYVLASSNSNALVSFSAGTKSVWIDEPAALINADRKNYIVGGDFSTNPWQRGTTFTSPVNGAYIADHWQYVVFGTAVHTIDQNADTPTYAQAQRYATQCLRIKCTTAQAVIGTDSSYVVQKIEGYNMMPLYGGYWALSFWHKHTKTGTYSIGFGDNGTAGYIAEYTQTTTDTWELATIIVPPVNVTWNGSFTNGLGMYVYFNMAGAGATAAAAPTGAWNSSGKTISNAQVNATDSTSNYMRFALVQLQPGRICTQFVGQKRDEVQAECERYYQKSFKAADAPAQAIGYFTGGLIATQSGGAGANMVIASNLPVRMRVIPSLVTYHPLSANAQMYNIDVGNDCTVTQDQSTSEKSVSIYAATSAGSSASNRNVVHYTLSAEL